MVSSRKKIRRFPKRSLKSSKESSTTRTRSRLQHPNHHKIPIRKTSQRKQTSEPHQTQFKRSSYSRKHRTTSSWNQQRHQTNYKRFTHSIIRNLNISNYKNLQKSKNKIKNQINFNKNPIFSFQYYEFLQLQKY